MEGARILENVAIDAQGGVFVTVYSHYRVDRYDPATHTTATFTKVPKPPMGLAFDANGTLWMTAGTLHRGRVRLPNRAGRHGPKMVRTSGCGLHKWITMHPNGRTLLVCESTPAEFSRSIWRSGAVATSGFREIGLSRSCPAIRGERDQDPRGLGVDQRLGTPLDGSRAD